MVWRFASPYPRDSRSSLTSLLIVFIAAIELPVLARKGLTPPKFDEQEVAEYEDYITCKGRLKLDFIMHAGAAPPWAVTPFIFHDASQFTMCLGHWEGRRRIFPRQWNVTACNASLPVWVVESLSELGDIPPLLTETQQQARRRCERTPKNRRLRFPFPYERPVLSQDDALSIPRLHLKELSPLNFYQRFVSRGLPVVLQGFKDKNPELWSSHLIDISRARHQHMQEIGCMEKSCSSMALLTHYQEGMPRMTEEWMPQTFDFSQLVSGYDTSGLMWEDPSMFSGFPGETFADRSHVDTGCDNDISIQLTGRKRWSLYAPVRHLTSGGEVIKPLTRMDTVLGPFEALYKPPGWFHNTTILDEGDGADQAEDSMALVLSFIDPPPYGKLLESSPGVWKNNPFGFSKCAYHKKRGWWKRSMMWNELMQKKHIANPSEMSEREQSHHPKSEL
eukprot:jgi/Bigna1/70254/fgenesh1_pg.11_\